MENASKALIMAGGVLIAILIMTFGVWAFITFGQLSKNYDRRIQETEINKFNTNFTKYENREDISIYEIISLAKFAIEYKNQTDITIQVFVDNIDLLTNYANENGEINSEKIIKDIETNNKETTYKVKSITYDNKENVDDGKTMVKAINFIKNT